LTFSIEVGKSPFSDRRTLKKFGKYTNWLTNITLEKYPLNNLHRKVAIQRQKNSVQSACRNNTGNACEHVQWHGQNIIHAYLETADRNSLSSFGNPVRLEPMALVRLRGKENSSHICLLTEGNDVTLYRNKALNSSQIPEQHHFFFPEQFAICRRT
jgi:hypothetical protein